MPCSNAAMTRKQLKFAGCTKLTIRSQSLVGRSSPYCEDMWRRYRCLWSPYVTGQTIIFSCCGYFFMAALCNRAGHYIFALWFLSSSFVFYLLFSSPILSGHRLDVYHKKSRQKSPSGHHRTTSSGYIFANKAHIDNRKKILRSNMSSTCPHNMVNFGSR